jgi:hypothetical protein
MAYRSLENQYGVQKVETCMDMHTQNADLTNLLVFLFLRK